MRLDLTSIMFNMDIIIGGGTPSWGTALGQGEGHKFTYDGCEELIVSMLYNKIDERKVYCPLGKGGQKQNEYDYILASKFDKIYVNDLLIPDASFVLLIVKQLVSSPSAQQHIGRRTLKYNPKITYSGKAINQDCFDKIVNVLGLKQNSAWFISDIRTIDQDEIHFVAKIVDKDKKMLFRDSAERKNYCEDRAEKTTEQDIFVKYDFGQTEDSRVCEDPIKYGPIVLSGNMKEIKIGGKK